MAGSVMKMKISSSHQVVLPDYPVSYRVANLRLFGEVLSNGVLLVYGGYDLVFCCSCKDNQEVLYNTIIIPRTFVKKYLPETTGFKGKERVQIITNYPLSIQVRAGKPSRVSLWKRLVSIFRDKTWVEVDVEGEISVQEERAFLNELEEKHSSAIDVAKERSVNEKVPQVPENYQAEKKDMPDKQLSVLPSSNSITLTIDTLADLLIQVIQQREKSLSLPNKPVQDLGAKEKGADQFPSANTEEDMLSEIMHRYAAQGKKEKGQQIRDQLKRKVYTEYDLSSIPLEKIPSRPGLQQTFVQKAPPPKPPEHSG